MRTGITNPFDILKKAVKSDKPPERRMIRHGKEREIIQHCENMLSMSQGGQELLDFARENEIRFTVLRGRTPRDYAPNSKNAYIVVPDGYKIDDPENVIHFTGALREAIQEYMPDLCRIGLEKGEQTYIHREENRFEDKLFWQTIVVYELGKLANKTEFIDSFTLMGYYNLIEGYEKDLTEN